MKDSNCLFDFQIRIYLFLHWKQDQRLHVYVTERVTKSPYCLKGHQDLGNSRSFSFLYWSLQIILWMRVQQTIYKMTICGRYFRKYSKWIKNEKTSSSSMSFHHHDNILNNFCRIWNFTRLLKKKKNKDKRQNSQIFSHWIFVKENCQGGRIWHFQGGFYNKQELVFKTNTAWRLELLI